MTGCDASSDTSSWLPVLGRQTITNRRFGATRSLNADRGRAYRSWARFDTAAGNGPDCNGAGRGRFTARLGPAERSGTRLTGPMPKKLANPELLRRKERVVAVNDLPGIPAGTPGKVIVVEGLTWIRYWVRFTNGVVRGSLNRRNLARPDE